MANSADPIIQRYVKNAVLLGENPNEVVDLAKIGSGGPKWTVEANWVTFQCGCRCERARTLYGAKAFDPVIFRDLPEQAVYDGVCDWHSPKMNEFVRFGGFIDFAQWKLHRRRKILGKVL